jgi:hypothetical protein
MKVLKVVKRRLSGFFFGQHFEQDHHSLQMADRVLLIINICLPIFELSTPLSYSFITHYILAIYRA